MPSPRWSDPEEIPIAAAIAAAVHQAWDGPEEGASNRFVDALRKLVGPDMFTRTELLALRIFQLQRIAPEGFEAPPPWAWFQICPKCDRLSRTKFTQPQNGRTRLQVLRDKNWLYDQLRRGKTFAAIAADLRCNPVNVRYFAEKHGLKSNKYSDSQMLEREIRRLHAAGEAPGTIAHELETSSTQVRRVLSRLGLANIKSGHHYFRREWWRVRLEDRKMTLTACAREAGIKRHATRYYVKKFDLEHAVDRKRRRGRSYPQLHDADYLRDLLDRHGGCYAEAAAEIGCTPSLVSLYARSVLGMPRKHSQHLPHSNRGWWLQRLDRGMTTDQMAEEAGIKEKTAREKLRILGLLTRAYQEGLVRTARAERRTLGAIAT